LISFTGDGAYDQDSVYRTVTDGDPDAVVVVPTARHGGAERNG
jgi:hypothetical protein